SFKRFGFFFLGLLVTCLLCAYLPLQRPKTRVLVECKAQKDDVLQMYYQDVHDPWFGDEHSEKKLIRGGDRYQTLIFEIPNELDVINIRLDLGGNREQGQMELGRIILLYKNDSLVLADRDKNFFFVLNENIDRHGRVMKLSVDEKGSYDPFIISRTLL